MMIRRRAVVTGNLALVLGLCGLITLARSQGDAPIARASFDADGRLVLPIGYRHGVHVGTRLKPVGINILDGLETKTPEYLDACVKPTSYAAFERKGVWPEGAGIVKEFSAVKVGDGCDDETKLRRTSLGSGIFKPASSVSA